MKRDGTQSPRTIGALLPAQHLRTSHSPAAPASLLFPKLLRSHLGSPPSLSLPSPPLTWSRPLPYTQAETTQMAPPFLSGFISCLPSDAAWQEILQMSLTFFPLLRDNGYHPKYGGALNRNLRGTFGTYEVRLKHAVDVCLVPLEFGILQEKTKRKIIKQLYRWWQRMRCPFLDNTLKFKNDKTTYITILDKEIVFPRRT